MCGAAIAKPARLRPTARRDWQRCAIATTNVQLGCRNQCHIWREHMANQENLLKLALGVFGVIFLLVYPLAIIWPSGWAWHQGAPQDSQYFMMIVGVYATLG